jgi:hypothetical protein
MPPQTATSPIAAAQAQARAGVLANRRAAAAGPTSSAVLKIAPTVMEARATARATATRYALSVRRRRTPRAAASSGLTELSSNGRHPTPTRASAAPPSATTVGQSELETANNDPNNTVTAAPDVDWEVVVR